MIIKENYPEKVEWVFEFQVPPGKLPERIDVFLTNSIHNATRNKVQYAIEAGCVTVNDNLVKANYKVHPNDHIVCRIMKPPKIELVPEDIPLDIIYEDDYLLVVNKPAGMVTHPAIGNRFGTLVNALLYHFDFRDTITIDGPEDEDNIYRSSSLDAYDLRPGIVHRLDKDTSGLLVVSKDVVSHAKLAEQFANRTIHRYYNALVWGTFPNKEGTYQGNIGRSDRDRKLFAVVKRGGKVAITDYKLLQRYDFLSLMQIKLRTGRTHQIRVHFSHNHHPVFGDKEYGGNVSVFAGYRSGDRKLASKLLSMVNRQMLHARHLGFIHPATNELMEFTSELPADFVKVLDELENH